MQALVIASLISMLIMFQHIQFDLGIRRYTWSLKYIGIWIAWTTTIYFGTIMWGIDA